jgi:hypothetical protein
MDGPGPTVCCCRNLVLRRAAWRIPVQAQRSCSSWQDILRGKWVDVGCAGGVGLVAGGGPGVSTAPACGLLVCLGEPCGSLRGPISPVGEADRCENPHT